MKRLPGVLLLAACAANEPAGVEFDSSAGLVAVDVAGDGFVRSAERRVPWEAIVLELRQRTRTMSDEQLQRFVVQLRVVADAGDPEEVARAMAVRDRLIDELDIMGVRQAKVLL